MFRNLKINFCQYDKNKLKHDKLVALQSQEAEFFNSKWKINLNELKNESVTQYTLEMELYDGYLKCASVGIDFFEDAWNSENYLMMPAAIYDGNRFTVSQKKYPPALYHDDVISENMPVTITDIPRLNINEGKSKIQLKSGDMATPAICIYNDKTKKGFILLFEHKTKYGYNGITFEESDDRQKASISIKVPAIRQKVKYNMCTTSKPSPDTGYDFKEGDTLQIKFNVYEFDCKDIAELYHTFTDVRTDIESNGSLKNELPYSKAMKIIEDKRNKYNWDKEEFYTVGITNAIYSGFQSGWVGGGIDIYPLYMYGDDNTKQRVKSTLNFIFNKMQVESGFFYGIYCKGKSYGDVFQDTKNDRWLLIRKNADMLYFLIKTYQLIKKDDIDFTLALKDKYIKACDAFVRLWNKYGQWGQFIDIYDETIKIGRTASAAAGIASMVLAYQEFDNDEYLAVSKAAGEYYYQNFTAKGLTNGGPGEILQAPDSESAFALVEGFVNLYDETKEEKWLNYAKAAADQFITWCVSYDFDFPKTSEFGRLDMKTVGTVFANCQNKHSAPGICTFSGDALFKLYRFTGEVKYLQVSMEIAHNIMQYVSRDDRPILSKEGKKSPSGFIDERVNMSDWENFESIGRVWNGSCWCECSAMLIISDLPSIYIVKDKNIVMCFDNVQACISENMLTICNPTNFDCTVSVFLENTSDFSKKITINYLKSLRMIKIKSLETLTLEV